MIGARRVGYGPHMHEGTRVAWRGEATSIDGFALQPGDTGVVRQDSEVGYGPASWVDWASGARGLHLDADLAAGFVATHVVEFGGKTELRMLLGGRLLSREQYTRPDEGSQWTLVGGRVLIDGAPSDATVLAVARLGR